MKLETLVGKKLCNSIVEVRNDSDSYEEIVLLNDDISEWNIALTEKLGPPLISKEEYETFKRSNKAKEIKSRKRQLKLFDEGPFIFKTETLDEKERARRYGGG